MDLALVVPKTQTGEDIYGTLVGMLSNSKSMGGKSVHLLLERQPKEAFLDERRTWSTGMAAESRC